MNTKTLAPLPLLTTALALALSCLLLGACRPRQTAEHSLAAPWAEGTSPKEIGERVAERFLQNPYRLRKPATGPVIHYVEACTWLGSLDFAQLTGDQAMTDRLVKRFDPLFGPEANVIPQPLDVDCSIFGAVPFELYIQTKDQRYLKYGLDQADAQWTTPADQSKLTEVAREAAANGLSWHTRYWIDDMYMITMLQTQAYRATGDAKYLDRAAREAVSYLEKLQQPNGLFFHSPEAPFFWGRGNGWFAVGMAELLRILPENHPHRPAILAGYRKMMATLLKHQNKSGQWTQLVDDPASWPESSCTGMFTYAFITGVKNGWLDAETYGPAARKGWLALTEWINPNGQIRDVCEGTNIGKDRQHYLNRQRLVGDLHGQAPVMWCATALLR